MTKTGKYILIIIGLILLGYILWYFKNIVAYILISVVLSFIGRPVVDVLGKVKIKKLKMPMALRAFIALLILWALFLSFFRVFIPLITKQAEELSQLNVQTVLTNLEEPINKVDNFVTSFIFTEEDKQFSLKDYVAEKFISLVNIATVSNIIGAIANLLGNFAVAALAVSFITFFFLKDKKMFAEAIILFIPPKHEESIREVINSIRKLLMRYFIGIIIQITSIILLITLGLMIAGINFHEGMIIGLFVGMMNVIPYIGPIIGIFFGLILGTVTHLDLSLYSELLPLLGYMALVFVIVQVIDNLVFQPLIYSSSVNAHPMEIFLVILIGGSFAGILGMILAVPTYTVLRVIAKEFFNNFKIVQKLTEKM